MSLNENEAARATQLRKTIEDLEPQVRHGMNRTSERKRRWRQTGTEIAMQAGSQMIGTLAAAGVAYLLAVVAGALKGTQPLNMLAGILLSVTFVGALWQFRGFVLPSHIAESKLISASVELKSLEVRAKLVKGERLTMDEMSWIQQGYVALPTPAETGRPSDE